MTSHILIICRYNRQETPAYTAGSYPVITQQTICQRLTAGKKSQWCLKKKKQKKNRQTGLVCPGSWKAADCEDASYSFRPKKKLKYMM